MREDYVFEKLINIINGIIEQVQCQINGGGQAAGTYSESGRQ